jgi:hypothetical protein
MEQGHDRTGSADDTDTSSGQQIITGTRSPAIRLLLIPFLLYLVWVLETYLLEGSIGLFSRYQPLALVVYTVFSNIVIGLFVPVICLRPAFMSGAVNMFQIGFRSVRRTILVVLLTALFCYFCLIAFTPVGVRRIAVFNMAALLAPPAVASVMVCWVIAGTHVQAFVRSSGAAVSIIVGILVTAVLYGGSFAAHSPPFNRADAFILLTGIGIVTAAFFFSVRDIYATSVFLTCAAMVFMWQGVDPVYLNEPVPLVYAAAALSLLCLTMCHLYLAKRFTTIIIPK